jgi:chorismate synthase
MMADGVHVWCELSVKPTGSTSEKRKTVECHDCHTLASVFYGAEDDAWLSE